MKLDTCGWIEQARRISSPNFDQRPVTASLSDARKAVCLLVIHNISLPPGKFGGDAIEQFFTNQLDPAAHPYFQEISGLRVSAHFLIKRSGELVQFVSTDERAWHAGVSRWNARERCNDFSIGIELEGCDDKAFEREQYECLLQLIECLRTHYAILDIVGHSDIAPERKTDPGPCFDWQRIPRIDAG